MEINAIATLVGASISAFVVFAVFIFQSYRDSKIRRTELLTKKLEDLIYEIWKMRTCVNKPSGMALIKEAPTGMEVDQSAGDRVLNEAFRRMELLGEYNANIATLTTLYFPILAREMELLCGHVSEFGRMFDQYSSEEHRRRREIISNAVQVSVASLVQRSGILTEKQPEHFRRRVKWFLKTYIIDPTHHRNIESPLKEKPPADFSAEG